jgi:hypothetical protein
MTNRSGKTVMSRAPSAALTSISSNPPVPYGRRAANLAGTAPRSSGKSRGRALGAAPVRAVAEVVRVGLGRPLLFLRAGRRELRGVGRPRAKSGRAPRLDPAESAARLLGPA